MTYDRYGEWILASDAVALGFLLGGAENPAIGTIGLVTYLVGPQVVHGLHRNGTGVALSIMTRVGLPVVLVGATGGRVSNCSDDDPETEDRCRQRRLPRLLIGGGIGILTAMVLDAAVYARRPAPPEPRASGLVPRLGWSPETGWSVGAEGRF